MGKTRHHCRTAMDSQLHFILSEVYQLQGKSDLAMEAMKEAVRLDPDELGVSL